LSSGCLHGEYGLNSASVRFKHRNLPLLLLQAREQVMDRFRPVLNEHGITEQQWRIVRALIDTGPLEPREIGERCRISSPSLAGVLARMEELGLIKRKRLDHDQRRVRVSLTARSRGLSARMAPQIEAKYRHIESLIGTEFSARFYRALDELIGALAAQQPRAAAVGRRQ
jgi:homoprotocatechuate degradation regulator HpaR